MRRLVTDVFLAGLMIGCVGCKSAANKTTDVDELVHVATVEFTNLSDDTAQEYLGASISEATTQSMAKIFNYYHIPDAKTAALNADLKSNKGTLKLSDLRSHGLAIDADLLIYGNFKVTKGKKGDQVDISMSVFRADKSEIIATLTRQTQVSNRIFDEIEKLAAGLVAKIAEYRLQLLRESGRADKNSGKDAKIELTRDSINIAPFIPPVF